MQCTNNNRQQNRFGHWLLLVSRPHPGELEIPFLPTILSRIRSQKRFCSINGMDRKAKNHNNRAERHLFISELELSRDRPAIYTPPPSHHSQIFCTISPLLHLWHIVLLIVRHLIAVFTRSHGRKKQNSNVRESNKRNDK